MSDVKHAPRRPSWKCSACSDPWPCADRRTAFLADYQGRSGQLRAVLGTWLIDAAADLTEPVEALHVRFVAWAYRR